MRFIDYNGSGGLDPKDIATSVAVETAKPPKEVDCKTDPKPPKEADRKADPKPLKASAGCATMVALMLVPALLLLIAL